MTVTLPLATLLILAAAAALVGGLAGILATWPKPAPEPEAPPPPARMLPRAGYLVIDDPYPTTPINLWSPHAAQLERTEAEIRAMTAAARPWDDRYLP